MGAFHLELRFLSSVDELVIQSIGLLKNYWHVVAVSDELKADRALKRSLYSQPLLIWRDSQRRVHAVDDCCAHRRSPLEVADFRTSRIVCPYHGWEYDQRGQLTNVPSQLESALCGKCSIPCYQVVDHLGFVWIHLDAGRSLPEPRANLEAFLGMDELAGWPVRILQQEFATNDELLIDNFMDPTHTAVVHDGLIRSSAQRTEHEMTISTHERGVHVGFAEREERVGVGLRWIFGQSMRVQHSDEFLLPNLVRVTYTINGKRCFVALIACTPLDTLGAGRTLAHIQLRYTFGWPDVFLGPILVRLARRVLKQDHEITSRQFQNMSVFPVSREHKTASDAVAFRVNKLREQLMQGDGAIQPSSQVVKLRF